MRPHGYWLALRSELFIGATARGPRLVVLFASLAAVARIGLEKLQAVTQEARDAVLGHVRVASDIAANAYGPYVEGVQAGLALGLILLTALAALGLASEREQGFSRHLLTSGISRSALVLARCTALHAVGAAMLAGVSLASWAAAAFFFDFGAVREDGVTIFSEAEVRSEWLLGLGGAAVTVPAVIAFGMLVSTCARSAAEAVAAALGLVLAFDVFKGFLGGGALYVYASYQPSVMDGSYLREVAKMARGYSDLGDFSTFNFVVPVPQAALLLTLALLVTARRKM